jgi:Ino eighty subunit 1
VSYCLINELEGFIPPITNMTSQDGARSPGSTVYDDTHPSSPIRMESDPRTSLKHVLGNSDSQRNTPSASRHEDMTMESEDIGTPGAGPEAPLTTASGRKKKDAQPGSSQNPSMYSGNKVRHLKKDDGDPLWRKDIQFDFLKLIFENESACFTNSYEPDSIGKQTFANLYIDAMARSSKTSKILRDKLLSEHEPAKNMAMVCLLVNLGRMNTTLNCKYYSSSPSSLLKYASFP